MKNKLKAKKQAYAQAAQEKYDSLETPSQKFEYLFNLLYIATSSYANQTGTYSVFTGQNHFVLKKAVNNAGSLEEVLAIVQSQLVARIACPHCYFEIRTPETDISEDLSALDMFEDDDPSPLASRLFAKIQGVKPMLKADISNTLESLFPNQHPPMNISLLEPKPPQTSEDTQSTVAYHSAKKAEIPLPSFPADENFSYSLVPPDTLLLKFRSFHADFLETDKKKLAHLTTVVNLDKIRNIIFDLRGNKGGSALYQEEILKTLELSLTHVSHWFCFFFQEAYTLRHHLSNGFKHYSLYVLIDSGVSHTAENFTKALKSAGAKLVGAQTTGNYEIPDTLSICVNAQRNLFLTMPFDGPCDFTHMPNHDEIFSTPTIPCPPSSAHLVTLQHITNQKAEKAQKNTPEFKTSPQNTSQTN